MYDLIIIGGGPAGVAAGVYAARKKLNTLLITEEFGGQSIVSAEIQNWIGTEAISGFDLAQNLERHVRAQESIKIIGGQKAEKITQAPDGTYEVTASDGTAHKAKAVIMAAGARRRKLGVPGEAEFEGKGVAYCATCDAPLFKGKIVAVVGGGNAGLESVIDLKPYASKIYLLERGETLRGDQITQEKVKGIAEIIYNAAVEKITGGRGGKFVSGLEYTDSKTNEKKTLELQGVFVEIGSIPNTEMLGDLVHLNGRKEIVIDHKTCKTSREGIWAAGDITDEMYKQNNISVGDGVKAALSAHMYLQNMEKSE